MNFDSKKKTTSSTAILPDDVILEILLRLDAKSLMRFKCVCKSWKSLISHSVFINLHRKHQLPYTIFANSLEPSEILSIGHSKNFNKISELRFPLVDFKSIEGSDNGILCLSGDNDTIYLWNPAINQVRKLPSPPISGFRLGFGYSTMTKDFKVVAVEQFKLFDIPKHIEGRLIKNIGKLSERLALYAYEGFTPGPKHYPIFQIWVMKEYGISTSWIKHLKIKLPSSSAIEDPRSQFSNNGDLGFTNDGCILISSAKGLHLYDPKNKLIRHLRRQTMGGFICFHDYAENIFQIEE
ncbi:F-box domain containing protein [Trema orientale]|uniref:F-box domain containing protein n=1 Tax=Trema orientale TaxID=63057 RepID=A0A2P5F3Y1_TREOI|nr:F-box domain containing protein [Trema orientale]